MINESYDATRIVFSVVIPTRNRPKQLLETLQAISDMDFDPDTLEVVVVADGLQQGLDRVIEACRSRICIRLIEQVQSGPGLARNAGAARARGCYLAFTDDDCLPTKGWLGALKSALDSFPGALVGGRTVNALQDNIFSETSQLIQELVYGHYNRLPEHARFLASNNMALRAEDFRECGGFDQSFALASEDREFCDRWLWSKRPMIYDRRALVRHAHRLTFWKFCVQHFSYGRGAAEYHRTRARRGSGTFAEHLSFHRNLQNWLTPSLSGGVKRQAAVRSLLFAWQFSNALGFLWGVLSPVIRQERPTGQRKAQ